MTAPFQSKYGYTVETESDPYGLKITAGDGRATRLDGAEASTLREYFAWRALAEQKPWLDAKPTEVWELLTSDTERGAYVRGSGDDQRFFHVERRLVALDVTDPSITDGRKIWSRDAS